MKFMTLAIACMLLAVGNARADLYLSLSDGAWGTVNVSTGVFTQLGNSGAMGDVAINPLTQQGYGISYTAGVLETINIANGNSAAVGQSVYTNNLGASVEGGLYETNGDLLRINQSTGAVTDLGGFLSSATIYDIAFNASDVIFASDSVNLYERALGASGQAVLLGNTGFNSVYGMAFENFVLYGFGENSQGVPVVFSINQTTGAGTFVADLTGGDFANGEFVFGAASSEPLGTAAPEPATLTLLGIGIAGMAGYGWRRRLVEKSH